MATATATRTRVKKTEYVNRTQGWVGVTTLDRKNDEKSIPVAPGDRIFLSDEEVELTEQAHVRRETSPFRVREIVHYDEATRDEIARFRAAPLSKVTDDEDA